IPDLFVGRPIVLTGRFKGSGKATVKIEGRVGGRPHTMAVDVDLDAPAEKHHAITNVWARSRIGELRDQLAWAPESAEITSEIRDIALKHGLMSEFTSFVAVDSAAVTAGSEGTTVVVPVPVPK